MFQTETQGTLAYGEQMNLGDYTMIYNHMDESETKAAIKVSREILQKCVDLGGALSGA